MERLALCAFTGLVAALVTKLLVLTALQGRWRMAHKVFRWEEDARAHGGEARPGDELEFVERAQAALRNDAENHPTMLAASGAWVALGASGRVALGLFTAYAVARFAHAYLMLRPRQPLRTVVYSVGQFVMLAITIDAVRRALVP